MGITPDLPSDFDPTGHELISGETFEREGYRHTEWTWLRQQDPVRYFEPGSCDPYWAITKHQDIIAISKNPGDWINAPRFAALPTEEMPGELASRHLLVMDPPEHGKYRNLISKAFTPRSVQTWAPKIESITRRILDRAGTRSEIDFVGDVSAPITIEVLGLMLGVPEDDWPQLFEWSNAIVAPAEPEHQLGATAQESFDRARVELFTYFKELAEARRAVPRDDIITMIAQGRIGGDLLDDFELLSYFFALVVAGNETTRNAMTSGLQSFYEHPGQWEALVADPGLLDDAVEEIVRWSSPVVQFARTATRDQTIRGRRIRAGDSACLFYASANRDEEVFEDPFDFRIERRPNPHLGFGRGEHVCLGAHLARLELRTLFGQLRERLVEVEPTGPFERVRSSLVGGVKRAPIRWKLRAAG
ncbi:MAG: cytochrome P450 [Deltaproteobacteria bacterium]|jgi:cholest-4-en-3-one 26-monooxygenase|nr:cytochrome P450 [Deltaproteobacteria bacterium]